MDDFTVIICDFEVIPEQKFTISNSHSVYKIGHGRLLVWRYFVLPTNCAIDPLLVDGYADLVNTLNSMNWFGSVKQRKILELYF